MSTKYMSIAVSELPFPPGLGKGEYKALERDMKGLLGASRYDDRRLNEMCFWEAEYQCLITKHLGPVFDPIGDIVVVARRALAGARLSPVFGVAIPEEGSAATDRYAGVSPNVQHAIGMDNAVAAWMRFPPRLAVKAKGEMTILDGRHRLSYLRSRIQPVDPAFPVLVCVLI